MKHIVIAGGGFAGVRLARKLRKQKNIHITLVNDSDNFRYSPALYRAVTGFKMGMARLPIEWMLIDSSNVNFIKGKVTGISEPKKQLVLEDGQKISYDQVVFALGAVNSYFGIDGLNDYSYGVKTFSEAMELKSHMHDSLVGGAETADENFVIVGAGPTGVELAGALSTYLLRIARKHRLKHQHIRIYLVEAGPWILPQMNERASQSVRKRLEKLGVEILTHTAVQAETVSKLKTSEGVIESKNVVWAAGMRNNPFFKNHPSVFTLDKRGYVAVDKHLQSGANIYVCGDNAATIYSGLAETAVSHADFIAKDIVAKLDHSDRPNHYEKSPIQVVPVGGKWAVLQHRSFVASGRLIIFVRRLADIVGYTNILGVVKAITIWSNTNKTEEYCSTCESKKS